MSFLGPWSGAVTGFQPTFIWVSAISTCRNLIARLKEDHQRVDYESALSWLAWICCLLDLFLTGAFSRTCMMARWLTDLFTWSFFLFLSVRPACLWRLDVARLFLLHSELWLTTFWVCKWTGLVRWVRDAALTCDDDDLTQGKSS